jgi:hypothetical protein
MMGGIVILSKEVAMVAPEVLERFMTRSPVSVMARGLLEFVFPAGWLDQMFRETAIQQREGELLFSLLVETLSLAVTSARKSPHAAYEALRERFDVSVNSFYNKLQGVEVQVSRALVLRSSARLLPVLRRFKIKPRSLLSGYRVKILDGNHLAGTERRLKEVRGKHAHPLPGLTVVVLDPQWKLILDAFPLEDPYAQERSLLEAVLETVEPKDLWLGDRAYCTTAFLTGIRARGASFLIRQHATALTGKELIGQRRKVGRCTTGVVYEQALSITHEGETVMLRRITIELDTPTSSGDEVIHLVTNLAHSASKLADLYLERWTIENAFQELGQALRGEINTLCYPKAALLAFCIASYTYNLLAAMRAAIAEAHPESIAHTEVSCYYLAEEIGAVGSGLSIAVPDDWWTAEYAPLTPTKMAARLKLLAAHINPQRFRKRTRRTRNPPPKRRGDYRDHLSAARLIAERR